jgi:hypothetical protein
VALFRTAQLRKMMRLAAEAMPDRFRFENERLAPVVDAFN